MNERIKELRDVLGLTLEKFGAVVGIAKGSLSNIEKGRNNVTNQMVISVCSVTWPGGRKVSETWLRTGEGEMFLEMPKDSLDQIAEWQGLDDVERSVVQAFMTMDRDKRKEVIDFLGQLGTVINR